MSLVNFIKRTANRELVYWSTPAVGNDGTNTFPTGVEILGFWTNSEELIRTSQGRELVRATGDTIGMNVYVTQDLDSEGMLYLGPLTDLTAAQKADPKKVPSAYEIKRFLKFPVLHHKDQFIRVAKI